MVQHIMKYYVSGHTAKGYVNFLSTNLVNIDNIIVLQHPSNRLKTIILQKLMARFEEREQIEVVQSTHSEDYIEGIIIREKSLAVLAEQVVKGKIADATYINLKNDIPVDIDKTEIEKSTSQILSLYDKAYKCFKRGLEIHDALEKIYIDEMDFKKADKVAEDFIQNLFKDIKKKDQQPIVYERLFGTNTSEGVVNVVEHLIEPIGHRVFIKGRAGTGKSVFMRKILDVCKEHGLDVELYRCSFDPGSVDMLIIRELDYCLFDSTDPHEFFPSREDDKVIDLYEETVTAGTDEKFASEIIKLIDLYKTQMREGVKCLKETKQIEIEKENLIKQPSEEEIEKILHKILII